ncbi:uncharacterized protein N7484_009766 [Penicillium longicatenatum]|uniref:uncharacterized protein n=1 Tax=Penicillium longicatenatum TaxID=1561947 RepID=UPI002547365B|nr:uncharacterized protein N7484_009766 [Penicillium longicatenatum]KAJ5636453.1 hypothetical protein N7484_009766 [Penicillium longicatenatum]
MSSTKRNGERWVSVEGWVEVWIVVRSFYEALWGVGYVSGDPVAEMRLGNLDKKQDNTQNRTGGGRMEEES